MKIQLHSILSLCLLPLCALGAHAQERFDAVAAPLAADASTPPIAGWRAPRTLLVSWRPDAGETHKLAARSAAGAAETRDLTTPAMRTFGYGGLEAFELPLGADLDATAANLRRLPGVRAVDFDVVIRKAAVSNDPSFVGGQTWGLYGDLSTPANQYGSQAAEAWASGLTGSTTVHVGVIDEGIDINHPDLAPNIWQNPRDAIDGIDNDGNGRIDDRNGWDFHFGNRTVYDGSATDPNRDSHGTHVAGIIGARGGNGVGGAGVCWNVKLISAKVLDNGTGFVSNAVLALDYLVDLKTRHGIQLAAINMSLGHDGFVQAELDAINRARMADILVVVAAGNGGPDRIGDNIDVAPYYPAAYSPTNIITVANITSTGALATDSNFGPIAVDLGAPGTAIRSTLPQNRYGSWSGTSMAAPFVTGAVALWRVRNPTHSASTTRGFVLLHRIATPSLTGKVSMNGRLNMSNF